MWNNISDEGYIILIIYSQINVFTFFLISQYEFSIIIVKKLLSSRIIIVELYGKNSFAVLSKNLAKYRSENNFIELSK